jgi:hypothetical protein
MKIKTPMYASNDKVFDFEVYFKNLKRKIQISFTPSEFGIMISRNISDFMTINYYVYQGIYDKPYSHISFTSASVQNLDLLRKH